jgi:hypothetical protein
MFGAKKLATLAFAVILGSALTISLTPAYAQKHGGGGGGHSSAEAGDAGHVDHEGGKGGKGGKGGQAMGHRGGGSAQSLRDIFHSMETGAAATSDEHGSSANKGGAASSSRGKHGTASTTVRGKKGSATAGKRTGKTTPKAAAEEDSDRPAWAGTSGREGKPGRGNLAAGTKKGDIYGDMYVLLRDENGVPIMIQLADGTWVVQPIGTDGKPLELDAEGNLVNPELAIPVDLGRLNVGRSPLTVLSSQYEELLKNINAAESVTVDASGRLVLTTNGVSSAVDSPLANLALYVELLNKGTITGVTDPSKFATNINYLVDGTLTPADMLSAASFLAAASDKAGTLTIDKVVDMNKILDISGTLPDASGSTYVDYSSFNYDRQSVYSTMTVDVLVKQDDGSYKATTVNVYDTVFKSTEYTGTNVAAFATAADDALQVIEYVHNYAIPESE